MWACVISSVVMGIAAAIVNYFILLPLFETFMPLDQLIASFGEFLPFIKTKLDVVLFNALPFNILKGLVIETISNPQQSWGDSWTQGAINVVSN